MPQPAVTAVELDRPRLLLYRPADIADAERALNLESFEASLAQRGFARLVVYLWAGLRHEDRGLTMAHVGTLLAKGVERGLDYARLWDVVSRALIASGLLRAQGDADPSTPPDLPLGSSPA